MALVLADRVQETTTTTGTGSVTLLGAVTGFQSFAAVGNTNTCYYTIAAQTTSDWEVGIGTYSTTGPTLARTTVLASSNSGSLVNFPAGTKSVFVTYPAEKSINYDANGVATIGSILGYSDTGIIGSFASTVAGYNQVIIQNKSSSSSASSNFNVSNDAATATTGYAELGINSSTYSGTGAFNIAGASYLASASTDLSIGTYGAYNVHFVTNSSTTDAMTIFNDGGVSLGGQPDPGIGTLYANNVYIGFTTVTAAAGTTVLTNSSSGWIQVVGTTTQTIQLPNATTLYKGLAYTVANNSTGNVTIKDNAGTTIDTVVTGGTSVLVLTANGTSAGSWSAYSYIPASYDFSTSTANFGTATITNATYNGNTITPAYGGTGLTTFTAANNALYSTGATTLTAGTLPVLAGGTGVTTSTGSGSSVLNTSPTLVTPLLGTPTSGNLANCTGYPAGSLTGNFVSTFSAGTTGFTPSTATTGAVTLAGTLNIANGGTGSTSLTANNVLLGNGTSALQVVAPGTSGNVLTSNGTTWVSSAPAASGATITGTTTSGTYYVVGTTSTSGSLTTASISNTNAVSYNANTGALSAVSMISSSDERLKTNWAGLDLDFVARLSDVKHGTFERISSGNREVGVTAQSLQKVIPEAVIEGDDGMLSVNYGGAALVATIELAKVVQELRAEIAALKAR